MVRTSNRALIAQLLAKPAEPVTMRSWLPLVLIALLAAACTSEPATNEARDLIFTAEAPQPTSVPLAEPADETEDTSTAGDPPVQLAFTEWTVDELIDALERSLDGPVTVTFEGQGNEVLEIDDAAWRVTSGETEGDAFITRGFGDDEWVTFEHVGLGIRSMQAFTAGTEGQDIDQLLNDTDDISTPIQRFRLDRFVLGETADLESTWVKHARQDRTFFTPSVLYPSFVEELIADVTTAVAAADTDGVLETTSTDTAFSANIPNTEFVEVSVSGDEITLSSQGGWSLTVTPGVEDSNVLGAPNPRDLLSRELLLTATSIPENCIATEMNANTLVDDGLVTCIESTLLNALVDAIPEGGDELEDVE